MFQLSPIVLAAALGLVRCSIAQQYLPPVAYDTVLKSPINPNITISYKTPDVGTCTTAFSSQKQYSGYVNLPPFTLEPYQQNYSINTFFWFFEARMSPETAPLTIWLNGGPGSSSMIGLFREAGPCEVVQLQDGTYGTQSSMWGWDRSSNVLFIDQPTQTGFSYDDAVNGTLDLISGERQESQSPLHSHPSWAILNGTFSSGHEYSTQNTSVIAASASWHFLQGFLSAFPKYNPGTRPNSNTTEPTGVNLFAESYGGQYGPAFANYFEDQNARRITGDIPRNSTLEIKLASVGIINGLVDELIQAPYWPKFAYNNTYGIEAIAQTTELNALSDFSSPGGCRDLITQCRDSMKVNDPQGEGDDNSTNSICAHANYACNQLLTIALSSSGRSAYDIRVVNPNSFPSYAYLEYLNNADVLRSIGAKVNFTESSSDVQKAFSLTGDAIRGTQLTSLASLLTLGVRVAFIYGDADIICNWYGGEAVSLQLAGLLPTYSTTFPAAGYADIISNSSYVGGQVRQYGNLSFSRIYDAGHTVPSYQAETAFTVFTRIIEGNDIGTGHDIDLSTFATKGLAYSDHVNKVPEQPKSTCWVRAISDTCTSEEQDAISAEEGVVKNGIWYAKESDYKPMLSSVLAGKPGSLPTNAPTAVPTATSSIPLTGVYTATGTPRPTSGASRVSFRVQPRDLLPWGWDNGDDESRRKRMKVKKILIGVVSGLGALLSLLLLLLLLFFLWRLFRSKKHNRRFLGGPRESSSPLPISEPLSKTPTDSEKPETLPPLSDVPDASEDRRPSRRLSMPMEPIPERDSLKRPSPSPTEHVAAASPRHSVDTSKPPGSPRRLSTHRNESITVPESTSPPSEHSVQQTPALPSRRSTEPILAKSSPAPSRKPSTVVPAEPTSVPSRKPSEAPSQTTPVPSRRPSEVPSQTTPVPSRRPSVAPIESTESEPVGHLQRSASLPPAETAPIRENTIPPEPIPESEERASTPPPRVATAPPSRSATAKVPERAATQSRIEVNDSKSKPTEV